MSPDGYYREKLSAGVSCLVGLGDIRDRLTKAFVSMITVDGKGFSDPELGKRYADLFARVTAKESVAEEGRIVATLRSMSDEEVATIAQQVLELHTSLQRAADLT